MLRNKLKRALTLIELVVVLLILVALASLVIPQLGGFVERTHAATSSDGISELNRVFQLNKTSTFREPTGLDTMLTNAATITAGVPGTDGTAGTTTAGELTVTALNAAQADALNSAGITGVFDVTTDPNLGNGESATFNLAYAATARTPADGANLVALAAGTADAAITREFGASALVAGATYFVFGVGENCSLVGSRIVEAPIHLGEENDPNGEYSRLVAVYAVTDEVKLVGIAGLDDGELKGLKNHVADYYAAANEG